MPHAILICLLILAAVVSSVLSTEAVAPFSEDILRYVTEEYGVNAEKHLRLLNTLNLNNFDRPIREKLDLVNTTMNKLP
jgi:hypothetical protein